MNKVLNMREQHDPRIHNLPESIVYVGRGSKWGNPYLITATQSRTEVIEAYRHWSWSQAEVSSLAGEDCLSELRNKDLICYCAPLPCHADILLEMIG